MDTELQLLHWRDGQTKAERLCADILILDSFSSVDPQCPLGGPDGIKDVLCEKNGWKYVGAAYFATGEKSFNDTKRKFEGDLLGVRANEADGIVFITNQKLSPTEREDLIQTADESGSKAILYHRERIRTILDSPQGFAHRLEYLGLDMSKEEQLSFFSQWDMIFNQKLQDQSEYIISALSRKMDNLLGKGGAVMEDIGNMMISTISTLSNEVSHATRSDKSAFPVPQDYYSTKELTLPLLCTIHNAICYEHVHSPEMGKLRTAQVWIGAADRSEATYTPPAPAEVPKLIEELLAWWRESYEGLVSSGSNPEIIDAIARFHHGIVMIHPFLDGNGRLARYLLMLQSSELLGVDRWVTLEDKRAYFNALGQADQGDFSALKIVITQAIYGVEEANG